MQTELSGGGQLIATGPTPDVVQQQGFSALPHLLTAGNYFVGGLMRIPHQLSVTAVAATKVSVIRIAATYVEQLEERFSDVQYVLRNRPAIAVRLKEALQKEPLFADLKDDQWAALETITGWEHVPSNLDVTRQGQVGSKLYVLAAGAALVRATDDDGKERPRHYSRVGIKDFYGINALLRGDRHGATVRSMVEQGPLGEPLDGTDWLTLQHDDVLYLTQSNSEQWQGTRLWQELSEKPKEKTRYGWQEVDEEIVLFRRRHWLWLFGRLAAGLRRSLCRLCAAGGGGQSPVGHRAASGHLCAGGPAAAGAAGGLVCHRLPQRLLRYHHQARAATRAGIGVLREPTNGAAGTHPGCHQPGQHLRQAVQLCAAHHHHRRHGGDLVRDDPSAR